VLKLILKLSFTPPGVKVVTGEVSAILLPEYFGTTQSKVKQWSFTKFIGRKMEPPRDRASFDFRIGFAYGPNSNSVIKISSGLSSPRT
jgi:hypothetical protein